MNARKWCILFVSLIILCLIVIMGTNYIVDPFGYFRGQDGKSDILDDDFYMREIKAEHILHYSDQYDAYLIGGSKAGALRTGKLKELDGYNYYNDWVLSGNFQDYYYNAKFILENAHPKKIILNISTTEFKTYDRENLGDIYAIPAIVKGTSKVPEIFHFLFKNLDYSIDELTKDRSGFFNNYETGERNLTKYYQLLNANPDTYYDTYMKEESSKYLNFLTTEETPDKDKVMSLCFDDLERIKAKCDHRGVEFQVIMSPVFVGEMIRFEGDDYYIMLTKIANLTGGFWCFSNFSDYNLNPFNFYNTTHYFYETGDLMIDIINGKVKDSDFGQYITPDNVADYIKERKERYENIRQYYKENQALPLHSFDDESVINKSSIQNLTVQKQMDK